MKYVCLHNAALLKCRHIAFLSFLLQTEKKTLFHMFIVTQYENTFTTVTLSISILS